MGQIISRAYRRLAQYAAGGQSRDEQGQRKGQHVEQHGFQQQQPPQPHGIAVSQSIPVGQSIDSIEYAALTSEAIAIGQTSCPQSEDGAPSITGSLKDGGLQFVDAHDGHQPAAGGDSNRDGSTDKPTITDQNAVPIASANNNDLPSKRQNEQVEEAVIKIQAFVRGHLTRKALKDAHQSPNSLGQSQFDEESLTRNPPCAVFLPSSPLSSGASASRLTGSEQLSTSDGRHGASDCKAPPSTTTCITNTTTTVPTITSLESIAEDQETVLVGRERAQQQIPSDFGEAKGPLARDHQEESESSFSRPDGPSELGSSTSTDSLSRGGAGGGGSSAREDKKLASICTRSSSSPSKLEMPPTSPTGSSSRGSASPLPSEACASIDLGSPQCDASASIDIEDHNIRQTDMMASVLHHGPPHHTEARSNSPEGFISTTTTGNNVHDNTKTTSKQHGALAAQGGADLSSAPVIVAYGSADQVASFDSSPEEAAAAVRIQSAFRGYRSRKNSPYRTRSPPNSGTSVGADVSQDEQQQNSPNGKRTVLTKQKAANTLSADYESGYSDQLASGHEQVSGEHRPSRPKRRLESDVTSEIAPHSTTDVSAASSIDESITSGGSNTTEDISNGTVKEAAVLSQQPSCNVGIIRSKTTGDSLSESAAPQQQTKPPGSSAALSQDDDDDDDPSTRGGVLLDSCGNTAPLAADALLDGVALCSLQKDFPTPSVTSGPEMEPTATLVSSHVDGINISSLTGKAPRDSSSQNSSSAAVFSPASTSHLSERGNSFDTDSSSALGAALSFNETDSMVSNEGGAVVANESNLDTPTPMAPLARIVSLADGQPMSATCSLDEDKSSLGAFGGPSSAATDEFEREARRLVDEMAAALDEPDEDEEPTGGRVDQARQLTIEMESDDIERRDPRGQVSLSGGSDDGAQIETATGPELSEPQVASLFGVAEADAVETNQDSGVSARAPTTRSGESEGPKRDDDDNDDDRVGSSAGDILQETVARTSSSSPANESDSNDADDGDDTNSDHENEARRQQCDTKTTGVRSPTLGSSDQKQRQQQQQGGSKGKKKNRNKKNKARK